MSTMRVTTLKNEASSVDQIVLEADGSFGGELGDALASKSDYPSGGSDGDLLTKSGTSTAWAAPSIDGLTLIETEPFITVSAISLNNVFTSDYAQYRLLFSFVGVSATPIVQLRLRQGGADNTASNYNSRGMRSTGSAVTATSDTTDTFRIGNGSSTFPELAAFTLDIFRPAEASRTIMQGMSGYSDGTHFYADARAYYFDATTQFDGFTLFPSTGTLTGTLWVYGYRKV